MTRYGDSCEVRMNPRRLVVLRAGALEIFDLKTMSPRGKGTPRAQSGAGSTRLGKGDAGSAWVRHFKLIGGVDMIHRDAS